ncbi:MAG: histidine phosphatase family protein [Comamonadaceae bacterium]|nr:histidine phosphatase family protein [Comamonadaceae bacterium]
MPTLYLVRHGQASFGAADYDQLSSLGQRQCVQLGRYFAARGLVFDAALSGTLKRHQQTLSAICDGSGARLEATPWPGLNEYDSPAVIAAIHPEPLALPITPELYRHYFQLLRKGMLQWMLGKTQPQGMPSWRDFQQGVVDALAHVRQSPAQRVLLVSSGGPIACAIGYVLATPPEATIELNMRLRNSSVTEFTFNAKRQMLQTFNTLPHLDAPAFDDWITHA